jgi:BirA family biotin operon repressor/biotin-[acetyl-CoA-carboxylase] ligase
MDTDDRILELFKRHKDSFLSGEEISRQLGISRQALWKHIEKLRHIGYEIEAVPHLGYRVLHAPDKMLAPEIQWELKTKTIGVRIHSYESVGSTNDIAYDLATHGAREGTVVIANEQTKGKGRLGRKWVSPSEGGIYISCILRPDILPSGIPEITLVAAVGTVRALREVTGLDVLIKWPNDMLISGKKAGGILTELKAEMDKIDFVILGIGINVNTPVKALPQGGTSLKEECKKDISRIDVVKALLQALEGEYARFKKDGFSSVRREFKEYSCTLGKYVSITTSGKRKFHGQALDIDDHGALVIRLDNGLQETFVSGDVTLVR